MKLPLISFNHLIKETVQKLQEARALYKRGDFVHYQLDKGSPHALQPSSGKISKVQKVGNYYQYTIQDGGPVPVWEIEILDADDQNELEISMDAPDRYSEGKLTEDHIPQIADEKKYTAEFRKKYGAQKTNKFLSFEIEPLAGSGYFNYRDIAKLAKKNKFGIWDTVRLVNAAYVNQVKGVPMNVKNEGLTEGKYDHMIGKAFKLPGRGNTSYKITKIEDDRFVHVLDDRQNSSMFDIKKVVKDNPGIDKKPKVKRTAWNKGTGDKNLISKREYAKILMGAMKDATSMGDQEATHDMAQSMIYDKGILARLTKDNPGKNSKQLMQQLQWDLEAAA